MSQEHVDLLRRISDGMNWGDVNEIDFRSFFQPDVEFLPLRTVTEGAYHGIAGIERFVADTHQTFETFESHYEYLDLGERVLAWGTLHVVARQSGIDTEIPVGSVVEFREGKIARWEIYPSHSDALKAVDLSE